ncbi:hypothetical protein PHMEG_00036194 [Phytophthora megakarya]|uniref:Reverse transcriptase n=1 Tax=Phytophthora megakarya TaxID=4795 RepID=A0A225UNM4_9STRA|nr:hypothetical protein PHMEG_00036194 [Phytophthora megakarya]
MKGLRDGPVKTYLFREYPSTLEAAITLAIQEEFSLKQAKLHTNVPRPPRPAAKTEGPEPMDLSYASAVGQQLVLDLDSKFDMVLGMPWLARHDPTIDWEKRTVVSFGSRGATESDGPVCAADTPNGASEYPSETVARAAVSGRSARSARSGRAVTTPRVVDNKRVSGP